VRRLIVPAFAIGAGGCAAILGISDGEYDPDPFGTMTGDAAVEVKSEDAQGEAPSEATAAAEASVDAPADAADDSQSDGATTTCGLLIDNLESDNGYIIPCKGRNGTWYTHNDGTTGGTQVPAPNVPFLPVTPGYESKYSAYTKGSGFTSAGAEMGFHFVIGASGPETYDLSAYTGITFMAKSAIANFTLYVNFPDANTCPGATNCGDTYGKGEVLGTTWAPVTVAFSILSTDSATPPHPFDVSQVYAVEFHAARNTPFEFWVDNVTLTK
jgi:hypothetical protein